MQAALLPMCADCYWYTDIYFDMRIQKQYGDSQGCCACSAAKSSGQQCMLQNHIGHLRVANKAGGKCHRPSSVIGQLHLHAKLGPIRYALPHRQDQKDPSASFFRYYSRRMLMRRQVR